METWQSVMEKVLAVAASASVATETWWTLVGSVATALQGAEIVPRDVDILTKQPEGVFGFTELMAPYTPEHIEIPESHDDWRSSREAPVSEGPDEYGFYWYFARWIVDGVKVEVAHIVGPEGMESSEEGAGIWEAGPEIWTYIRKVPFRGYQVPVVPLEIQLETSLHRGLEQRVSAIVDVFRREGYDETLIDRCLCESNRAAFEQLLDEMR